MIGIRLETAAWIDVGRLGQFLFPAGWYGYSGSARGSGGLRARLARHQRASKRLHWHVDYVLAHGVLQAAWWLECPIRLECAWAAAVQQLPGVQVIAPRFGSSDCHCRAHLAYLAQEPPTQVIDRALALVSPRTHCFWRSSADNEVTVR